MKYNELVQFEEIGRALLVAVTVGVAATLLGTGLSAWLLGRAFRMSAVAVFVALLFFGWLWGGWGLLVGVPLLLPNLLAAYVAMSAMLIVLVSLRERAKAR